MRTGMPTRPRPSAAVLAAVATTALAVALAVTALAPAAGRGHQRVHRRAKTVRVKISEFAFHPRTLRVKRGSKVVFANTDSVAHTATRRGSFDTGHIRPHRSLAVKLRRPGVYRYVCTIHPFMHGKILVR